MNKYDNKMMESLKQASMLIENLTTVTDGILDTSLEISNEISSLKNRLNEVELNYEQTCSKKTPLVTPVLCVQTPYPRKTNMFKRAFNGIRRYFAHS
tara:strand:- start:295 stop:585 length:291 start_codon:yes stop_codon:yes gene_type:complete